MGENDSKADAIIREVFGATSLEVSQGKKVEKQVHDSGGVGLYMSEDKVSEQIKSLIVPDFISGTGEGKVLHRYVGERDVYMVMDVPEGTECFFRATGKVELWNASDGTISDYPVVRQTKEGTWLRLDKEPDNSYLLSFQKEPPL